MYCCFFFFFFNDTATTEIYTLSLHDALPIFCSAPSGVVHGAKRHAGVGLEGRVAAEEDGVADAQASEEATCAGADHGFVVELIGDTHARLEDRKSVV